jgi:xanthine/CO dehydrogenase XdhC/CoxF family maturation factor
MSSDLPLLFDAFDRHRERGDSLVLATIVSTEGSTYRKPGARMLLEADGDQVGILGGGCFEGDLAIHARNVLAEDAARIVEYDMRGEDDLVWGLGLGCNGLVRILLQPLTPAGGYEPFAWLRQAAARHGQGVLATVLSGGVPVGASLAVDDKPHGLGLDPAAWPEVVAACRARAGAKPGATAVETAAGPAEVFFDVIRPVPHLLILGAGPDAVPVALLARQLCWRVTVADHRPAWVRPDRFPAGCEVVEVEPERLGAAIDLSDLSAAVVMSHHFKADEDYLGALAAAPPAYVGLLGPAARRDALLETLDNGARRRLEGRVRGPVGLDLGGRSPQAISLSLIAEIQATLTGRDATPMDARFRASSRERAAG